MRAGSPTATPSSAPAGRPSACGLAQPLLGLLRLPGLGLGRGTLDACLAEDMGMALDHLVVDGAGNIVDGEGAGFARHLGVEDDLQQQVAQLVAERRHVAMLDGVGDLIGFLDRIGRDAGEILLEIPGAAAFGIAQPRHDGDEALEGWQAGVVGIDGRCGWRAWRAS